MKHILWVVFTLPEALAAVGMFQGGVPVEPEVSYLGTFESKAACESAGRRYIEIKLSGDVPKDFIAEKVKEMLLERNSFECIPAG